MTGHPVLARWISKMAGMCKPDRIVWIDGSEKQKEELKAEALATGELVELDQKKWPGCLYHRTCANDVARTEHLTYICSRCQDDAGPTNNWMTPGEAYARAGELFQGSMKGRAMYVIPFSMGPAGSPFSKIGIELTDSIYVVLNMLIMTRVGPEVLEILGTDGEFSRGLHSKGTLEVSKRLILHFPEDNTIWSIGSGYGGNVLLGKKCLSLRIASYLGRQEGWLAEHMLIMGIEDPRGKVDYVAAAFPSACGKTNLAMMIPPASFRRKGYKVWSLGDDIAWIRPGKDGRLWALNPENGFFGVAPGTNSQSNPNAMAAIKRDTIFTNVMLTAGRDIWWEDGEGEPPPEGIAWNGIPWKPGTVDSDGKEIPGAHPNSRFTAPIKNCPIISSEWENPQGVPLTAIIFGGRRSDLVPLVYQSFNWRHGVYTGATLSSELTAAQYGKLGRVRRDPMAMLPFCGYHMGDYFQHWLDIGEKIANPPNIFHVNWFKRDGNGSFLWPGFRENFRVLDWIIRRSRGEAGAVTTPLGLVPKAESLELEGLNITAEAMEELLKVETQGWKKELAEQKEFFQKFGERLPKELLKELKNTAERI